MPSEQPRVAGGLHVSVFLKGATYLYKYLTRAYAEKMVETGEVRVATLYEFQNTEQYGDERGDNAEGRRTVYSTESFDERTIPAFAKDTLIKNPLGVPFKVQNVELRLERQSPNLYIYSTCQVFDRALFPQFKCDACVLIRDAQRFFIAITEHLKTAGLVSELLHVGPCRYQPRLEHHTVETALHPALVKDPKHAHQREVRALWQPATDKVEPVVVVVPEVKRAVQLIRHPFS